jgi:hypothetical protein
MDFFFLRTYVISSPSLILAVQRNSKALTFEALMDAAAKLAGVQDMERLNSHQDESGHTVHVKSVQAIQNTMLGEGLNEMNARMIGYMKVAIDSLDQQSGPIALHSWLKHAITIASTDAMYGPRNPYRDPKVEKAFWYFPRRVMNFAN